MKCPRCEQDNPSHANFCLGCGVRLTLACGFCGAELPDGARSCFQCGHAVATSSTAESRPPVPRTYTPKHLAEKILTSRASLEGERKRVTVLFADLKGSMELLAGRDPEDARKLLDPVLELMMDAVHRYEGTVNQVMGDGIMALFGAPLAHEDHALRACYAALRMQEAVKLYADNSRRTHGVRVQIRIGINSGEVVVRAIGSDLRMDYSAVGEATHLAARMEQLASPGSILLTASTLGLAQGLVAVKPLGPVTVKGLGDAVEVYELTGAGPARTRLQAAAGLGLTRFVAREAELERLRRVQQLAGGGQGQVAAVVGDAGVGKSRLVHEFVHSRHLDGWMVLESASVSYGTGTSYLPVIDLLKSYFRIQDRDDLREVGERVTAKVLGLDEALTPTLPALLALLDVPTDGAAWQTLDPSQRRQRTFEAVKQLLLRQAREQALLVVLEDLHWIDGETQVLLDTLVEDLSAARILLLVNYRPEYQDAWTGKAYHSHFRLDALPTEGAGELLDALLGDEPGLAPLKQMLVKRGNPFFLEETVRTLVETRALAGERGHYRLTQPVQTIQVPPTVHAMLAARIDRLAPDDKHLLQIASVVGKDVPSSLLRGIAELPDEELQCGLDRLRGAEFLYEARLYPEVEYTFTHALTHEVTYGGLLREHRRVLHGRIVAEIEALAADRLNEQVERLAHHAVRGEVWPKAVTYLHQAGYRALMRAANREGIAYLERASAALLQLPATRERAEMAVDLHLELYNGLWSVGEREQSLQHARAADEGAQALGDLRRQTRAKGSLTQYFWITGNPRDALETGRAAVEMAAGLDDPWFVLRANFILGMIHHVRGELRTARAMFARFVEWFGPLADQQPGSAGLYSAWYRTFLARCLADLGEFAEATAHGEEAVRIAEAVDQWLNLAAACSALGYVALRKGDFAAAVRVHERGLACCRERAVSSLVPQTAAGLGYALALSGRVDEAVPLLREGVKHGESIRRMDHQSIRLAWLSEGLLRAGRVDEAGEGALRSLEAARRHDERANEGWILCLLGEIELRRGSADSGSAERHFLDAVDLASELGMRPLVAHGHFGLGKLYGRTGRRQEARQHLATATTLYRELDMRSGLEQVEVEMTRVP
jgi:class 3 adenylate cyclase/tetratricopeptide (TPR) repeat protein